MVVLSFVFYFIFFVFLFETNNGKKMTSVEDEKRRVVFEGLKILIAIFMFLMGLTLFVTAMAGHHTSVVPGTCIFTKPANDYVSSSCMVTFFDDDWRVAKLINKCPLSSLAANEVVTQQCWISRIWTGNDISKEEIHVTNPTKEMIESSREMLTYVVFACSLLVAAIVFFGFAFAGFRYLLPEAGIIIPTCAFLPIIVFAVFSFDMIGMDTHCRGDDWRCQAYDSSDYTVVLTSAVALLISATWTLISILFLFNFVGPIGIAVMECFRNVALIVCAAVMKSHFPFWMLISLGISSLAVYPFGTSIAVCFARRKQERRQQHEHPNFEVVHFDVREPEYVPVIATTTTATTTSNIPVLGLVYKKEKCVICLEAKPTITYALNSSLHHQCTCQNCYDVWISRATGRVLKCPCCRGTTIRVFKDVEDSGVDSGDV
jgi:hypothetical protein